jgi:branched-chain amino acid transport system permease protein
MTMNRMRVGLPTLPESLTEACLGYRGYVVAVAAAIAALMAAGSPYGSQLLALILIYALAVAGWNVVSGYAGQPSLGHAAFFGMGAYGAAVWTVQFGRSPWIGIAVGALVAGVLAMLVGFVSWRLKIQGIYFALILFAVSELLLVVVSNIEFLGGTTGLFGITFEDSWVMLSFKDPRWFAAIAGVLLLLALAGTAALSRSRLGRQLAVVRHDEVAAEASGIDTMRVKVMALGISAVITAVAGGLYAQLVMFIQPDLVFGMGTNLRFILIGILGGMGTLWGPLVGSVLVTTFESVALEAFGGERGVDGIAFGLLLVVAVSFLPRGLAWRRSARSTSESPARGLAESAQSLTRLRDTDSDGTPPAWHAEPVLVATGLTKRFGGLTVVDDVSLQLMPGKIHGLIGPNGAGKTTLINMLTGTITRDAGEITLEGRSLEGLSASGFARAGIARTFQIPRPLGDLTVWDSVLVAAVASQRTDDPEGAAARALDSVALSAQAGRTWESLNGSQQRRVEVARALAQEPRVLLLDEPMSGLGAEEIDDLAETIRTVSMTHPEMTILFVEHLMRVMMTLADRITVLDRGRLIAEGTPAEVSLDRAVIDAYLGSSIV